MDHPLGIHGVQRGYRVAVIPEFAVVIILDDVAVLFPGIPDQGGAAACRQNPSQRELVRGRYIYRTAGLTLQIFGLNPQLVDRDWIDGISLVQHDLQHPPVAGVFHADRLSFLVQQVGDQI